MSLGGLTAIRLAAAHPNLVRRLVMVDVTPAVTAAKSAPISAFVDGAGNLRLLRRTAGTHRPVSTRPGSVSLLRRGLLHNAPPRPDGGWPDGPVISAADEIV